MLDLNRLSTVVLTLIFSCFASFGFAATATWDGGGSDNNWTTAENWVGDVVPATSDDVVFDGTSTKDCTIDSSVTVKTLSINSGYTGTLTQNASQTITVNGNVSIAAGTFAGSDAEIDCNGTLTISAGTFTSTSGQLKLKSHLTISGGTFNHNSGTFLLDTQSKTIDAGTAQFNNVVLGQSGTSSLTVTGSFDVNGDLTISGVGYFNGGSVLVAGDVVTTDTSVSGSAIIEFNGAGAQSLNASGGTGALPNVKINKSAGTLTLADSIEIDGTTGWEYAAGTVDAGTSKILFKITTGVNSGSMSFNDVEVSMSSSNSFNITGDMIVGNDLTVNSVGTINNGTIKVAGDIVTTDASVGGSGAVEANGSGAQQLSASGGTGAFPSFKVNKPAGTLTIADTIEIDSGGGWEYIAGTVDAGTSTVGFNITTSVDAAGMSFNNVYIDMANSNSVNVLSTLDIENTLTIISAGTINNGTVKVAGDLTILDATVGGSAVIELDGNNNQLMSASGGTGAFPNLTVNKSGGTLTIQDTFETNGDWKHVAGTVDPTTSTIRFVGNTYVDVTDAVLGNIVLAKSNSARDVKLLGTNHSFKNVDIAKGDLVCNATTINISGDLSRHITDGSLEYDTSTVIFDGTDQSITGSFTFYNLTKSNSGSLTFEAGETQTIANALDFSGSLQVPLTVQSSTPGTQWGLTVNTGASQTIDHVVAQDSDASAGETIVAYGRSVDNGNNLNWDFSNADDSTIWDGGGTDNNWSTPENWLGDVVPGSSDEVVFSSVSTKDCLVDVNVSVYSISINNGYTGTVTQNAGNSITTSHAFAISDGLFAGGDSDIDCNGTLTFNDGNFTSTSGQLKVAKDITVTGGVYNHNSGTLVLDSIAKTIDTGPAQFYDVEINQGSTSSLTMTSALDVEGSLSISSVGYVHGTIRAAGDILTTDTSVSGSGVIVCDGSGAQLLHANGGTGAIPNFVINKSAGALNIADTIEVDGTTGWTHTAGTVAAGTSKVVFTITTSVDAATMSFNDVELDMAFSNSLNVVGSMNIGNDLTITSGGTINNGSVKVSGDVTTLDDSIGGSGIIEINGSGAQLLNAAGGTGAIPSIQINKTGGTLSIADVIEIDGTTGWTHLAGAVSAGASKVVFTITNTITAAGMDFNDVEFNAANTNSMTIVSNMNVANDLIITLMGYLNDGIVEVEGDVITTDTSVPGSGIIEMNGSGAQSLNADGGTGAISNIHINKVSGTLSIADTIEVDGTNGWTYTAGTVDAGSSKVIFKITNFVDADGMTFNDVELDMASSNSLTVRSPLDVDNDFTITSTGRINGEPIHVAGDVTTIDVSVPGSSIVELDGNGAQSLGAAGGSGALPNVTINKSGGTLSIADTIETIGDWTQVSGTVDPGASTVRFVGNTYVDVTDATLGNIILDKSFASRQVNILGTTSALGDLTLTKGTLDLNDSTFIASGDLSRVVADTGIIHGTSSVLLTGSDQSITGPFSFYNLTKSSTTGDKLSFEPGQTQTIVGALNLSGTAGTQLIVESQTAGSQWGLDLASSATQNVTDVAAQDSDASSGETIYALGSSIDNGNNINWNFPVGSGQYVWDGGAGDNYWSSPENWDGDMVPVVGAHVTFNNTSDKNAVIDQAVDVASITVDNGYDGTINQQATVTLSQDLLIDSGRWQANDQSIASAGNVTIANERRRFIAGTSTVTLTGTGTIANKHGTNRFYNLHVAATGHTTTVADRTRAHRIFIGSGTLDCNAMPIYVGSTTSTANEKIFTVDAAANIINISGFRFYGGAGHTYDIDGAALNQLATKKTGCLSFYNNATYKFQTRDMNTGCVGLLGDCTLDLNGNNLTTIHDIHVGRRAFSPTLLLGTSTVSCRDFKIVSNGNGTPTANLGSATINVHRHWRTDTGGAIIAGTSNIVFDGNKKQNADFGASAQLATITVNKTGNKMFFKTNGFTTGTLHIHECQTVRFQNGQTFAINDNFTLAGTASCGVKVESITSGSAWLLNVDANATQSLSYVCAQDSDASSGAQINAANNGCDDGGNTNWNFVTTQPLMAMLSLTNPPTAMETLEEDEDVFTFDVTLTGTVSGTVVINVETSSGVAAVNSDFTLSTNSLSFTAAGTQQFTLSIDDDAVIEGPESLIVSLSSTSSVSIVDVVQMTIVDGDEPALSVEDASDDEGDQVRVIVNLDQPAVQEVTVNYTTGDSSPVSATAGTDYTVQSGVVTISIGDDSADIFIQTTADNDIEGDETFIVTLSASVNATIQDAIAEITIVDDDTANTPPNVVDDTYTVAEGGVLNVIADDGVILGLGKDTDIDNDPLTATVVRQDTNGTLEFNADGSGAFVFTHDDSETPDTFTFDYELSDGVNPAVTGYVTINITPVNDAPELAAIPSPQTTNEGELYNYTLSATDPENDALSYFLIEGPADMSITGNIISWTPEDVETSGNIVVEVRDPSGLSDQQNFVITVLPSNDAPIVDAGVDATHENLNAHYVLAGVVTDDGKPKPASLLSTWSVISAPAGATASFWNLHDPATKVTFSHLGTYVLRLTANDSEKTAYDEVTITVEDPINVTLSVVGQTSISETGGTSSFQINLSEAVGVSTFVEIAVNGSATDPNDYTLTPDVSTTSTAGGIIVEIPANTTQATLSIVAVGDTDPEGDESINAQIVDAGTIKIGSPDAGNITIVDDETLPLLSFETATMSVLESDTVIEVKLNTNIDTLAAIKATYTISGDVDDIEVTPSIIFLPFGYDEGYLKFKVPNDQIEEGAEQVVITIDDPDVGDVWRLGANPSLTIDIQDPYAAKFSDASGQVSVNEDSGTLQLQVELNRVSAASNNIYVAYTIIPESAEAGWDFSGTNGTLSYDTSEQFNNISIPIYADTLREGDETFRVIISQYANASEAVNILSSSEIEVTILDAETGPLPTVGFLNPAGTSVTEANTTHTVSLDLPTTTSADVVVQYQITNGTAIGGLYGNADYENNNAIKSVTIPANSNSAQIDVAIYDDVAVEGDETFTITLLSATNATLNATASHIVTINDSELSDLAFSVDGQEGTLTEGTYQSAADLSVNTVPADSNAVIYISDSGVPAQDPGNLYTGTFQVTGDTTYTAIVVSNGTTSDPFTVEIDVVTENDFPNDSETAGATVSSITSPYCWEIASPNGSWADTFIRARVNGQASAQAWILGDKLAYVNAPLTPETDANLEVFRSDLRGVESNSLKKTVKWVSTDITSTTGVTIRSGDSLLLKAGTLSSGETVKLSGLPSGVAVEVEPGVPMAVAFPTPGNYVVNALVNGVSSDMNVTVLGIPFANDMIACEVDYQRAVTFSDDRLEYISADTNVLTLTAGGTGGVGASEYTLYELPDPNWLPAPVNFLITPLDRGRPIVVARIPVAQNAASPIVGFKVIDEFTMSSSLNTRGVLPLENATITLSPYLPELYIKSTAGELAGSVMGEISAKRVFNKVSGEYEKVFTFDPNVEEDDTSWTSKFVTYRNVSSGPIEVSRWNGQDDGVINAAIAELTITAEGEIDEEDHDHDSILLVGSPILREYKRKIGQYEFEIDEDISIDVTIDFVSTETGDLAAIMNDLSFTLDDDQAALAITYGSSNFWDYETNPKVKAERAADGKTDITIKSNLTGLLTSLWPEFGPADIPLVTLEVNSVLQKDDEVEKVTYYAHISEAETDSDHYKKLIVTAFNDEFHDFARYTDNSFWGYEYYDGFNRETYWDDRDPNYDSNNPPPYPNAFLMPPKSIYWAAYPFGQYLGGDIYVSQIEDGKTHYTQSLNGNFYDWRWVSMQGNGAYDPWVQFWWDGERFKRDAASAQYGDGGFLDEFDTEPFSGSNFEYNELEHDNIKQLFFTNRQFDISRPTGADASVGSVNKIDVDFNLWDPGGGFIRTLQFWSEIHLVPGHYDRYHYPVDADTDPFERYYAGNGDDYAFGIPTVAEEYLRYTHIVEGDVTIDGRRYWYGDIDDMPDVAPDQSENVDLERTITVNRSSVGFPVSVDYSEGDFDWNDDKMELNSLHYVIENNYVNSTQTLDQHYDSNADVTYAGFITNVYSEDDLEIPHGSVDFVHGHKNALQTGTIKVGDKQEPDHFLMLCDKNVTGSPYAAVSAGPSIASVDLKDQNLFISVQAERFDTPALGPNLTFFYNSLDGSNYGWGVGWRTNYDMHVVLQEASDETQLLTDTATVALKLVDETGRIVSFDREAGKYTEFNLEVDGYYVATNVYKGAELFRRKGVLTKEMDKDAIDELWPADPATSETAEWKAGERFRLNRYDNLLLYFDARGYLTRVRNLRGEEVVVNRGVDGLVSTLKDSRDREIDPSNYVNVSSHKLKNFENTCVSGVWSFLYDDDYNMTDIKQGLAPGEVWALVDGQTEINYKIKYDDPIDVTINNEIEKITLGKVTGIVLPEVPGIAITAGMTKEESLTTSIVETTNTNVFEVTKAGGGKDTYTLLNDGRISSVTEELTDDPLENLTSTYTYDGPFPLINSVTIGGSLRSETDYDVHGDILGIIRYAGSEDVGGETVALGDDQEITYTYTQIIGDDPDFISAKLLKSVIVHDVRGIESSEPRNLVTFYTYHDGEFNAGRLRSKIDPAGATTTYVFTNEETKPGYLESVTDPLSHTLSVATTGGTTAFGDVKLLISETGRSISNAYKVIDGKEGYDGLVANTTNVRGHKTEFLYDDRRRVKEKKDPAGITTKITYTPYNGVSSISKGPFVNVGDDGLGSITELTIASKLYDPWLRQRKSSRPGEATVETFYVQDESTEYWSVFTKQDNRDYGHTVYDLAGRMVSNTKKVVTLPLLSFLPSDSTTVYLYDPSTAYLKSITNAVGNTIEFKRNLLNQAIEIKTPEGNIDSEYELDDNDEVLVNKVSYNSLGMRVSKTNPLNQTNSYIYNEQGLLVRAFEISGVFNETIYDLNGRRVQTVPARGKGKTWDYDADGINVTVSLPDGSESVQTLETTKDWKLVLTPANPSASSLMSLSKLTLGGGKADVTNELTYNSNTLASSQSLRGVNASIINQSIKDDGRQFTSSRETVDYSGRVDGSKSTVSNGHDNTTPQTRELTTKISFDSITGVANGVLNVLGLKSESVLDKVTGEVHARGDDRIAKDSQREITKVIERDLLGRTIKWWTKVKDENDPGSAMDVWKISERIYDKAGRVKTVIHPTQGYTEITYTPFDARKTIRRKAKLSSEGKVIEGIISEYFYNKWNLPVLYVDNNDFEWHRTYNALGMELTMTNDDGTTYYEYDPNLNYKNRVETPGNRIYTEFRDYTPASSSAALIVTKQEIVASTGQVRRAVSEAYNELGQLTSRNTPEGTEAYERHLRGAIKKRTRLDSKTDNYSYHDDGTMKSNEIKDGTTTLALLEYSTDYPVAGGMSRQVKETVGGQTTTRLMTFDRANQLVSVQTNSDAPIEISYFTGAGMSSRGPLSFEYDNNGLLTGVTDSRHPDAQITNISYFPVGSNAKSGMVERVDYLNGMSRNLDYTTNGLLKSVRIDFPDVGAAATNVIGSEAYVIAYDGNDRISQTIRISGDQFVVQDTVANSIASFFSDPAHSVSGIIVEEREQFYYNNKSNLIHHLTSQSGITGYSLTQHVFDILSNREKQLVSAGNGVEELFTASPNPGIVSLGAHPDQVRFLGLDFNAVAVTTDVGVASGESWAGFEFGNLKIHAVCVKIDENNQELILRVDDNGTIREQGSLANGQSAQLHVVILPDNSVEIVLISGNGELRDLASVNGLTTTNVSLVQGQGANVTSTPVLNGLRVHVTTTLSPYAITDYTYDNKNQLTTSITSTTTTVYSYTANGHLYQTTVGGTVQKTHAYDALNRLSTVHDGSSNLIQSISYNAGGWQRSSVTNASGTTSFVWDGDNLLSATNGGSTIEYAYHNGSPLWEINEYAVGAGKVVGTYVKNHRGDVTGVYGKFDSNPVNALDKGLLRTYRYDPYGKILDAQQFANYTPGSSAGYAALPLANLNPGPRYRGYWHEGGALALYHTQNRHYDPSLGRFLQLDPARAGKNYYAYADGDPVNRWDPNGLYWKFFYVGAHGEALVDNEDIDSREIKRLKGNYSHIGYVWVPETDMQNEPDPEGRLASYNQNAEFIGQALDTSASGIVNDFRVLKFGRDDEGNQLQIQTMFGNTIVPDAMMVMYNGVMYRPDESIINGDRIYSTSSLLPNQNPEFSQGSIGDYALLYLHAQAMKLRGLNRQEQALANFAGDLKFTNFEDAAFMSGIGDWLTTPEGKKWAAISGVGATALTAAYFTARKFGLTHAVKEWAVNAGTKFLNKTGLMNDLLTLGGRTPVFAGGSPPKHMPIQPVDPKTANAVFMTGGDPVEAAIKASARMADSVKDAGNCMEYARKLRSALRRKGHSGTHLRLEVQGGTIYDDVADRWVGNDLHDAIRVGDTVFDNFHPQGVPFDDWIDSLIIRGPDNQIKKVTESMLWPTDF